MTEESSFKKALATFSRSHFNTAKGLRAAMSVYREEEMKRFSADKKHGMLQIGIADTEAGPETALFITGFKNIAEIEAFLLEKLGASGK